MQKYIVFNTINTVIDAQILRREYTRHLTQYMTVNYGGKLDIWKQAYHTLVENWANYHTDLDFGGQDGLADMRESRFRTIRVLFNLAKISEPNHASLVQLSQQLPVLIYQKCVNPEMINTSCLSIMQKWHQTTPIVLATYTFATETQALIANTLLENKVNQIVSPDNIEVFNHDASYFQRLIIQLKTSAQSILYIDYDMQSLDFAKSFGIQTFQFNLDVPELDTKSIDKLLNQ